MGTFYFRGGDGDGDDTPERVLAVSDVQVEDALRNLRTYLDSPTFALAGLRTRIKARLGAKWGDESKIWLRRMLVRSAWILGADLLWTPAQLAKIQAATPPDGVIPT